MKSYQISVHKITDIETDAVIDFVFPGMGNSPEAETIKHDALRAAKRRLRATSIRPLRYHIESNKIDQLNRLHQLVVRATVKEQ